MNPLFWSLVALLPWSLLFAFPLASLFHVGSWVDESLTLSSFLAGLLDPLLLSKVRFTAGQAALSALLSGFLGLPLGLWLRHSPRATDWLKIPFSVPTLVVSAAWVTVFSWSGTLYSLDAVILAHVVLNIPWVASLVSEAAAGVPESWDELARSLGAGRVARFRIVDFPVVAPAWFSALSQVFLLCSMSFTLVTILGGGPPVETLETAIHASVRTGTLDLVSSSQLAIWQLLLSLVPWVLLRGFWRPVHLPSVRSRHSRREPGWHRLVAVAWVAPYLLFLVDLDWSLFAARSFWVEVRRPLLLSLGLASAVSLLSVAWTGVAMVALSLVRQARRQRILELFFLMPSGVSTLTLSLGFWLAYARWIDPFEGSFTALVLVQGLIFFPLVFRWLWPLVRLRSESGFELARSLGATPLRAWLEVEWPRLRQPVIHALALVAAASTGELAAVSFFSSERMVTLPLLVSRWLSQYRFDQAHAVVAILLGVSVALTLGTRWRPFGRE